MSQENVEIARRAYEHFLATGHFLEETMAPGFVWDMSHFTGWTGPQQYEGIDGARAVLAEWREVFEFQFEVEELHDAGDRVVAVVRQRGSSQATGMPMDMSFAQVVTFREGRQTRMEMYVDASDAFRAAGLER